MTKTDALRVSMAAYLMMHYVVPSENLPEIPQVGICKMAITAWRCSECSEDFHMDKKPEYCPFCGAHFEGERNFGR